MKPIYKIALGFFMLYLLLAPKSFADWAYKFVVYDGKVYVLTDEESDEEFIVEEIGEVTYYSDMEGTYSGNFSNTFPKETEYFSIKTISSNQAIAVKSEDDLYFKATYSGEYAGGKEDYKETKGEKNTEPETNNALGIVSIILIVTITLTILVVYTYINKSRQR